MFKGFKGMLKNARRSKSEGAIRREKPRFFNIANISIACAVLTLPWIFIFGYASWIYYGDNPPVTSAFAGTLLAILVAAPPISAVILGVISTVWPPAGVSRIRGLMGLLGGIGWCAYALFLFIMAWLGIRVR